MDCLCSILEEKGHFFKDSGKTAKLNKRTEQLFNDYVQFNISCLNERKFFELYLELPTERKITNYASL